MINSVMDAIAILQDLHLPELEREEATHYLQAHPTPQAIRALVATLEDDDCGVRWACGAALAMLGEDALPILLEALADPNNSRRLRDSARHVLYYNIDPQVQQITHSLFQALRGPAAQLETMEIAFRLLHHLNQAT
jgi:HEAT repeat protein